MSLRSRWARGRGVQLWLGLSLAALALPSAAVAAGGKPTLKLSLPAGANEGASIPFSWTAKRLGGKHTRLVIQRPVGTAHTWKTMQTLPANHGSATLPGVPLGHYRYRLAAIDESKVVAQQVAAVAVFGEVPFSTLFGGVEPAVEATPTTSFPYVASWGYNETPAFSVAHNDCISVHVGFVTRSFHGSGGTTTVTLVQEAQDPVSGTAAWDSIGAVDGALTPGQTWAVNISSTKENADEGYLTYVNGYAMCSSREAIIGS